MNIVGENALPPPCLPPVVCSMCKGGTPRTEQIQMFTVTEYNADLRVSQLMVTVATLVVGAVPQEVSSLGTDPFE